ncbi:hypothetical protein SAMN04489725_11638 [Alicyclobacillus hesperidum]|uniref:Uncharacterized protein n=1 Tax=Alicyclobacillus hesperidum TaxID=89784 RepID=A0A1H2WQC8_9BACL|nr:hypothetical protein SAMN04489725_11638 [Alicyclobacillus hesperidum]
MYILEKPYNCGLTSQRDEWYGRLFWQAFAG